MRDFWLSLGTAAKYWLLFTTKNYILETLQDSDPDFGLVNSLIYVPPSVRPDIGAQNWKWNANSLGLKYPIRWRPTLNPQSDFHILIS
jgi:hypothetical protein